MRLALLTLAAWLATAATAGAAVHGVGPADSLDAAYHAAAPGDTVQLAAGTYPGQAIRPQADKPVTFAPAPGARVQVQGPMEINSSHVTVRDITATDITVRPRDTSNPPPVSDVTLQNVDGRNFNVFSASDVRVLGGDWGPASDCGGPYGGSNNSIRQLPGLANPLRITIDGATIHDVQSYDLSACHIEGLAIFAGQDVTVRNSKFYGNSVYDIFVQANSGAISGLTLENNFFAVPVGTDGRSNGRPVGLSSIRGGFTIRNNSFNGELSLDDDGIRPAYTDAVVTGNIGDIPGCSLTGIRFAYNVWRGAKCASTDVNLGGAALPYRNRAQTSALDYHLTGGKAVDLIPAGTAVPADDIDGDKRPIGAGADAGADEIGGSDGGSGPGGGGGGTPVPAPKVRTLTVRAAADAALRRGAPRRRGGRAKLLRVARGRDALLAFRVKGVGAGRVTGAKLRLYVAAGKPSRLAVRRTRAGWKESKASWRRSPKGRARLATLRKLKPHRFVTADLTGAVTQDGVLSLRLSSPSRRGVLIASRSRGKRAPRLELALTG